MKHGTVYAKKVKRAYAQVKKQGKEPQDCGSSDPLEQLILAVLSEETTLGNARKALDKLYDIMVDANEIRVSSPREISEIVDSHIPNSGVSASRLCKVLNAVFSRENRVSLDSLRSMGKRDAKRCLEEFDGIEPYHVASVMLWSLSGHAIPVNAKLFAALRKEELVAPNASVAEVQSFLERHIPPAEAKTFSLMMTRFPSLSRAHAKETSTGGKSTSKSKEKSATRASTKKKSSRSTTTRRGKAAKKG